MDGAVGVCSHVLMNSPLQDLYLPSNRPIALDLFCGGGGVAKGLQRAGWFVVGVDIAPQPRYCGDRFVQADALTVGLEGYDFIWSSPPCQRYSQQTHCRPGLAKDYPDLIGLMRERLVESSRQYGTVYVIENVVGAPLRNPIMLCGRMFGLELYRHRLFESNLDLGQPIHPAHHIPASKAGHWRKGTVMSVAGHVAPMWKARQVMEIDWMNRAELGEAIPPAYSEWIGGKVMERIRAYA